ncbi:fungal pheromone STE3G-protein-coupled receptor, partial [Stereum hirsutum FP-91666 SS1]|uniref:fungal pheromone STE3G-protein-coupled receptor n=1 Tax=Stereum hirsutum (strain FP-91666) TaxID=721885 RepID=UPI000444A297
LYDMSTYPAFSIFAFLGLCLVMLPLPWHMQAWNSGTCLYMFWVGIACLNFFVNSVVWHGNATDLAPAWCEISIRIILGSAVAIPAASLCINRRLYIIASGTTSSVTTGLRDKQKAILVDMVIGLGIPVVQIVSSFFEIYSPQGHRYDIYEDFGCFPAIYNTPVAYALVSAWPLAIGSVSGIYCLLTLRTFVRRRSEFNQVLRRHSSLTFDRYFRLMALASADLLITIPISAYGMYLTIINGTIQPWISWADTHFDYPRVNLYPLVLWQTNHKGAVSMELTRWMVPACAIVFFGFFGFAQEAKRGYRKALDLCIKHAPFLRRL